jgi:hypothetical protein
MMRKRRFALYFAWSRPKELGAPLGVLENRYPTLFEFRRALWPIFERLKDPGVYSQDLLGFLDHVVLTDFEVFRRAIKEATGHEVPLIQREGDQPPTGQLDDQLLKDVDTLIIISLDHFRTRQDATQGEIDLVRNFLTEPGRTVVVCPHHDIGRDERVEAQKTEYEHHGDHTIPAQQRFGGFSRTLLEGLGMPIENRFGLNPARAADGSPAPLLLSRDLDKQKVLEGVTTFNLHPHLPHLHVPPELQDRVDVLARQVINLAAPPHPFVQAGNRSFNALLQLRPPWAGGNLFACDATMWSSAFGGLDSLRAFWGNLGRLPV